MADASPMRLSALAEQIKQTLQNRFALQIFWVLADVSNHKFYPDKQVHYFDLVEKDPLTGQLTAKLMASAWGNASKNIAGFERSTGQTFTSGIHILVCVAVEFHNSYGLRLNVVDVDIRFTLGELEKQKQETLQKLLTECSDFIRKSGDTIITRNKGQQFNPVLQKLAIVTSKHSAGYADFMHTLEHNPYGYAFSVDTYHAQVQGEANAVEIVNQLIQVFYSKKPYDAVIIIRGGGAETDFLLFNDYHLCRAIAKFPIPIITGIGHLKDQSLADLMAHTETKTPTKSAEYIIAHNRVFEDRIHDLRQQIIIRIQQQQGQRQRLIGQLHSVVINRSRDYLADYQQEMNRMNRMISHHAIQLINRNRNTNQSLMNRIITKPQVIIAERKQIVLSIRNSIDNQQKKLLKNQQAHLQHFVRLIRMASPEQTLNRGFAIIRKNNQIVVDPDEIKMNDDIQITLKQTAIFATVNEKKDGQADNL